MTMHVLDVRDGGEQTRILIGCDVPALDTLKQLRDLGYQVWYTTVADNDVPTRSKAEAERASLLMWQLQG